MTHEQKLDQLRQSQDYQRPVIAGEAREFCLGPYGLRLAKERGVDVLSDEHEGFASFVAQLWAGLLPFDTELEMDDVGDVLSLKDMLRLKHLVSLADSDGAEAEGKPEASAAVAAAEAARNGTMETTSA